MNNALHDTWSMTAPLESSWDSFFDSRESVSDDFMPERPSQQQAEREEL